MRTHNLRTFIVPLLTLILAEEKVGKLIASIRASRHPHTYYTMEFLTKIEKTDATTVRHGHRHHNYTANTTWFTFVGHIRSKFFASRAKYIHESANVLPSQTAMPPSTNNAITAERDTPITFDRHILCFELVENSTENTVTWCTTSSRLQKKKSTLEK